MLTTKRKGEIALLLVVDKFQRQGIHLGPALWENVREITERIGISFEEGMEFMEGLAREMMGTTFPKPKASKSVGKRS